MEKLKVASLTMVSRKFILSLVGMAIVGVKILFQNGGPEWGWILTALSAGYMAGNVASRMKGNGGK